MMNESDTQDIRGGETDDKNPPSISRRALLMGLFALPIAAVTLHPEPAQAQFGFPLHLLFRGGGYRHGSQRRHGGGGRRSRRHGGGRATHRGHSRQGGGGHSNGGGGGAKGPSGGSFH